MLISRRGCGKWIWRNLDESNEITVIHLPSPFVPFVIPEGPIGRRRVIIVPRARVAESDGTMSGEREARTQKEGRKGRRRTRGRRSSTSVVYSCSIMPRPLQASFLRPDNRAPAFLAFSPPPLPPHPPPFFIARVREALRFLTFRATFITHRLLPADSSWWLRRAPCCRRSRRLGTAFGSHSWARPSARPWRVADVCTRRPCYSPRTRATAYYRTRCAHSCQRRRKAGGRDVVRDCCDTPADIRHE